MGRDSTWHHFFVGKVNVAGQMKCKLVPTAPTFYTSAPSFPHPRDIVTGLCACRGHSVLRGHCVHCVRCVACCVVFVQHAVVHCVSCGHSALL